MLEVAEHVSFRGVFIWGSFERFMENNPETPIRAHTLILLRTACFMCKILFKNDIFWFILLYQSMYAHPCMHGCKMFCAINFFYAFFSSTDFEDLFDDDDIQWWRGQIWFLHCVKCCTFFSVIFFFIFKSDAALITLSWIINVCAIQSLPFSRCFHI